MVDTQGVLRLQYDAPERIISLDVGCVVSVNISMNKAVSTIPLVSMGVDRTFQLETGSSLQYTVTFKRQNPTDHDDTSTNSLDWSNAHWYYKMNEAINRWQMKTDGFRLVYTPDVTNPYTPPIDANGYIKTFTRKYSNKFNDLIEGSFVFVVGTMHVLSSNIHRTPVTKTYSVVILKSSTSDDPDHTLGDDDVVYMVNGNNLILPDMPPSWTKYADYMNISLTGWKKTRTTTTIEPIGGTCSFTGSTTTLYAAWDENEGES